MTRPLKRLAIFPALIVACTLGGCMSVPSSPTGFAPISPPPLSQPAIGAPSTVFYGTQSPAPAPIIMQQPGAYVPVIQSQPPVAGPAPVLITYEN